jgi:hypothetical protein
MAAPRRMAYGKATLLALAWVAGAAVLTVVVFRLCGVDRSDTARLTHFQHGTLLAFGLLPFLAGGVHRSVRVVTMTAFFEAALLAVVGAVVLMSGNG